MKESYRIAFQVFAVIVFSASVALFVNAGRENRLPLIMPFPPEYRPQMDSPAQGVKKREGMPGADT